jgi:hypothetical protein
MQETPERNVLRAAEYDKWRAAQSSPRHAAAEKSWDLEIVNCARIATCLVVLANHGIQLARREHRKKKSNARREFYAIEIGSQ